MLTDLFDEVHAQYRSLPLLGSVLDDFDEWLAKQGYTFSTRQNYIIYCARIERYLWKRKVHLISDLSAETIAKCRRYFKRQPGRTDHAVVCLQHFLEERQLLSSKANLLPLSKIDRLLIEYRKYLIDVRGLSSSTIQQHYRSAAEFLRMTRKSDSKLQLEDLDQKSIEKFICMVSPRLGRGSLQHVVAHVRSLLRYLAMIGEAPAGLDAQIDTPRAYRQEQLPKSLPWDVVRAFVESIDRTEVQGMRDYAMFLLIATYGLRASDVAGLKLDDIDWRKGEIRFNQRKTKHPLVLPLFDQVGKALLAYLRKGRPPSNYREIFLTLRAPISPVTIHTIGPAFRARVRRGNLPIPFEGVHCLRHSYAMHLLRKGASLKAIGDVLGHHSTESTCVYLRLDFEELRDVALPLPVSSKKEASK